MVKMRQDGKVENRAVYFAIGINQEGRKPMLGLWANGNEGAKYWMAVLQNLKSRDMKDCIVHLIRAGLNFVNWKERKDSAADLKCIYRAATVERAAEALADLRRKYPKHQSQLSKQMISMTSRKKSMAGKSGLECGGAIPFLSYSPAHSSTAVGHQPEQHHKTQERSRSGGPNPQ